MKNFDVAEARRIINTGSVQEWVDLAQKIVDFYRPLASYQKDYQDSLVEKSRVFDLGATPVRVRIDAPFDAGNWLRSKVGHIEIVQINLNEIEAPQHSNERPGTLPESNAIIILDEWLNSSLSNFQNHESKAKKLLGDVISWLETLGDDFVDLLDMVHETKKDLRKWDISNQVEKLDILHELVKELGQVYLELTGNVVLSIRDKAIANGSTKEDMTAYINALAKEKAISITKKMELLSYFKAYKSQAVACSKLRMELRKL